MDKYDISGALTQLVKSQGWQIVLNEIINPEKERFLKYCESVQIGDSEVFTKDFLIRQSRVQAHSSLIKKIQNLIESGVFSG